MPDPRTFALIIAGVSVAFGIFCVVLMFYLMAKGKGKNGEDE